MFQANLCVLEQELKQWRQWNKYFLDWMGKYLIMINPFPKADAFGFYCSRWLRNIVEIGKIAYDEQFLLLLQCLQIYSIIIHACTCCFYRDVPYINYIFQSLLLQLYWIFQMLYTSFPPIEIVSNGILISFMLFEV